MDIVNEPAGYQTSRNYARLWDLAQKQSVVCLVDYLMTTGNPCRDVCKTSWDGTTMRMNARGISYLAIPRTKAEFIKQCQECNVEWIVPHFLQGNY